MPAAELANACRDYNTAVWNLQAKLQQDRQLHAHELANAYMEATVAGAVPAYLGMLETMLAERQHFNTAKSGIDAAEWKAHEDALRKLLGVHVGVVTKGSRGMLAGGSSSASVAKRLMTAARSYNAQVWNLHRKLQHDRAVHAMELGNLYMEATRKEGKKGTPAPPEYADMLQRMLQDRLKHDARKTALVAAQWHALETQVQGGMGRRMARHVLSAGADLRLTGGEVPDPSEEEYVPYEHALAEAHKEDKKALKGGAARVSPYV